MQYVFLVILLGALAVGLGVLGWLGFAQRRRRRGLMRAAHHMGLKFSPEDPFELSQRYPGFVLASAGHSQRAENVLYGQHRGWLVRLCDYSFETGHGTQRTARRYSLMVVDTDMELPATLMWHIQDAAQIPLEAAGPAARVGPWLVTGEVAFAAVLAEAFAELGEQLPVSIQTSRRFIMLCSARRLRPAELEGWLASAVAGLCRLRPAAAPALSDGTRA
ncbi:MAG: hypothetical protein B1H04_04700 [Planctomycetales bacterium 4484_123]|nr:MAG: hypothetical protein B1H04_04700 [Planctomycetales bacterium 4484_123]